MIVTLKRLSWKFTQNQIKSEKRSTYSENAP